MTATPPSDDAKTRALAALHRLLNDALCYRDGYGTAHEDAKILEAALSHPTPAELYAVIRDFSTLCGQPSLMRIYELLPVILKKHAAIIEKANAMGKGE